MTDRTFDFQREDDGSITLEAAVYQALGAASVAWREETVEEGKYGRPDKTERVFDSQLASDIGEKLVAFIEQYEF